MQLNTEYTNNLTTHTPSQNKHTFLHSFRFNIVLFSDPKRDIPLATPDEKYHFISAQYNRSTPHTSKGRSPTIKRNPINWVKQILINIATYNFLQDCSKHIFHTFQILFIYIFFIFITCYFINEFTFNILHPTILQ